MRMQRLVSAETLCGHAGEKDRAFEAGREKVQDYDSRELS